jgi:3-polyprenyl-4-hydroxybenzoate decarboxylase
VVGSVRPVHFPIPSITRLKRDLHGQEDAFAALASSSVAVLSPVVLPVSLLPR